MYRESASSLTKCKEYWLGEDNPALFDNFSSYEALQTKIGPHSLRAQVKLEMETAKEVKAKAKAETAQKKMVRVVTAAASFPNLHQT
ncbi:hypothetical protein BV22DRAFT_1036913 [Leucogyrophana mollusca]|uniref:Uncharacterized protein n=1 Tax=Leucogyrophana mollusca TaxID=85980 RepID=A0ACB8BB13_9AGAM|nr:hypothetical protein BV22DRAFT_1036913 [Leucogyrophana mollusca]